MLRTGSSSSRPTPAPRTTGRHFASLLAGVPGPPLRAVGGRPLFFVYQAGDLPEPARFVRAWQAMAVEAGLGGLHLVACLGEFHVPPPCRRFDAGVLFRFPFGAPTGPGPGQRLIAGGSCGAPSGTPTSTCSPTPRPSLAGPVFPAVYPNWDNTPRSGRRGVVATGLHPRAVRGPRPPGPRAGRRAPEGEQVLVIKSWNEWAEGNYLEPDRETGTGRLEALRRELVPPAISPTPRVRDDGGGATEGGLGRRLRPGRRGRVRGGHGPALPLAAHGRADARGRHPRLGGDPGQLRAKQAVSLAEAGYARVVLVSLGGDPPAPSRCTGGHRRGVLPCGSARHPRRGGVRARQAADHHWTSMIMVPERSQATRARMLFRRCSGIRLVVVPVTAHGGALLFNVVYEWGALAKALVVHTSC